MSDKIYDVVLVFEVCCAGNARRLIECKVDQVIMPVEGTPEGSIIRGFLLHHSLHIMEEIRLFVNYFLLVVLGVRKEEIEERVFLHGTCCTGGVGCSGSHNVCENREEIH